MPLTVFDTELDFLQSSTVVACFPIPHCALYVDVCMLQEMFASVHLGYISSEECAGCASGHL